MPRIVSVWFPRWPLQRLLDAHPDLAGQSLLVVALERGVQRVVACAGDADRAGVSVGTTVADARALCGEPRMVPHDPLADRVALEALARWCQRFSPIVGVVGPEESRATSGLEVDDAGLLLDVTGCAHLFGGEGPLLDAIDRGLRERGFRGRAAMADTIGAAWAVARFGRGATALVPPGACPAAVRPLPIESLRLVPAIVAALAELGVTTVGRLERLPRSTLPARFGTEIVARLDEAFGRREEDLVPVRPLERLRAGRSFEPPLGDLGLVERGLGELLERLLEKLRARREGVLRLAVRIGFDDGPSAEFEIGCARSLDDSARLRRLLSLRLGERGTLAPCSNGIALPRSFAVERLSIEVTERGPVGWRRDTLFETDDSLHREVDDLVERLSQRLGERAVLRPRLVADPQPEFAFRHDSVLGRSPASSEKPGFSSGVVPLPFRPLCLLSRPEAIAVACAGNGPAALQRRGRWSAVVRWSGPERIETGWWRREAIRRDYYRVETDTGHRLWLFHDLRGNAWFLHGMF